MCTYIIHIALNCKRTLYTEVAYTNCLASSLNISISKTPVPSSGVLFIRLFIDGKLYYNSGLSLNKSIDLTSTGCYGTHSFSRLCAFLTFLTRAHVRPETPTHVPLQPLFIPDLAPEDSSSSSNVFVLTTHSYVYVAFSITTSFSVLYPGLCLLRDTGL